MKSLLLRFSEKRNYSALFRDPNDSNKILTLTDAACEQLRILLQKFPEKNLRVAVEAGGCHGFQYKFSLETSDLLYSDPDPDDM